MTLNLDLQTTIRVIFILALLGVALSLLLGIQSIRSGSRLYYFKKRRDLMVRGWRLIVMSFVFIGVAYVVQNYAEPVAYEFFPPSPTPTVTPTNTLSPTVTLTPSITWTPSITPTPAISNTPQIPSEIQSEFSAFITPNPEAVFSPVQFALSIDEEKQPIEPSDLFINPIEGAIYATFSYDKMLKFEGNTYPFLLYSYVRIKGIKRKLNDKNIEKILKEASMDLNHQSEIFLALHIARFLEIVQNFSKDLLPNRLCDYLYELADKFNAFFRDCQVIGSKDEKSRLLLCDLTSKIFEKGFKILGLETVDRM